MHKSQNFNHKMPGIWSLSERKVGLTNMFRENIKNKYFKGLLHLSNLAKIGKGTRF
jgi:hypothetical protein